MEIVYTFQKLAVITLDMQLYTYHAGILSQVTVQNSYYCSSFCT